MMDQGLKRALAATPAGTRYALAKALGLSTTAVQRWRRIPAERVVHVERVTGIPREKLRPDLYRLEEQH